MDETSSKAFQKVEIKVRLPLAETISEEKSFDKSTLEK